MDLEFKYGYAIIFSDSENKWCGVINTKGIVIHQISNSFIEILNNGLFKASVNTNRYKEYRDEIDFQNFPRKHAVYVTSGGFYRLFKYSDFYDEITNSPDFNYIGDFVNKTAIVNNGCEYLFEESSDSLYINEDVKGGIFGVINDDFEFILELKYNSIKRLKNGNFLVSYNNVYTLINSAGKSINNEEYEYSKLFETGNIEVNNRSMYIHFTLNDYLLVYKNDKVGLIDHKGNNILSIVHKRITLFYGFSLLFVFNENDDTFQIYTLMGKLISEQSFIDFRVFYTDKDGELKNQLTHNVFDYEGDFDEYIEKECIKEVGKVSEASSRFLELFRNGTFSDKHGFISGVKFFTGEGWIFYDTQKQIIYSEVFQNIYNLNDQYLITKRGNKFGLANRDCTIILEPEFNRIWLDKDENMFVVKKEGKIASVNEKGEIISQYIDDIDY